MFHGCIPCFVLLRGVIELQFVYRRLHNPEHKYRELYTVSEVTLAGSVTERLLT